MISIDQVLLLEQRVESAVKKIEQLNAENAALRSKCAELSNALNAKSEQFSSFQSDQSKIEEGILKALSRLNAVENVVLSAAGVVREPSTLVSEPVAQEQVVRSAQIQPAEPQLATNQINSNNSQQPVSQPQAESLPSEIEVPVQSQNNSVQPKPLPQEPVQNPAGNTTPDIGFEFGSADSKAAPEDSKQPMFDIF